MTRKRVGLIGNPVKQSLSPVFQQVAFDAAGIDTTYELWLTEEDEISTTINRLRGPDYIGANVTVPYKPHACQEVDELSERARRAGAVNTIVNRNGQLFGDNTDIPGFLAPLSAQGVDLAETNVIVLGAGGAARGVVVALLEAGCSAITVANRTKARAESLRDDLDLAINVTTLGDDLDSVLPDATLLVNSTAMGWSDDDLPISRGQLALLHSGAIVYDLTYKQTAFLRVAAAAGFETIDGLPMLVHQGAESFRIWTGQEPPIDAMWQAAVEARRERENETPENLS
jgi:shikimate dehydrogenase